MKATMTLAALNLSCVRQHKTLFSGISFQLNAGEVLIVEGPNGSGKSSLLRLLTGIAHPSNGEIHWQQQSIYPLSSQYTDHLHYVGHAHGIKSGLTVRENMQLSQHLAGAARDNLEDVLEKLQLHILQHTPARQLSAGQKRRLALSKLFLIRKSLWIVDEPLTALDTTMQKVFLDALKTHVEQGGLCVLSSHHAISLENVTIKQLGLKAC